MYPQCINGTCGPVAQIPQWHRGTIGTSAHNASLAPVGYYGFSCRFLNIKNIECTYIYIYFYISTYVELGVGGGIGGTLEARGACGWVAGWLGPGSRILDPGFPHYGSRIPVILAQVGFMLAQAGLMLAQVGVKLASCWLKLAQVGLMLAQVGLMMVSSWVKSQFWRQVGAAGS